MNEFIIANLISLLVSIVRSSNEEWKIQNKIRSDTRILIELMNNKLISYLESYGTRTSPARRKMAGKRNRLGRVYEPGRDLSEPLREEIIEMYNEGLSLTDVSNNVKVTVRGVNKIINRHGGSGADVVTDDVLHCIEI